MAIKSKSKSKSVRSLKAGAEKRVRKVLLEALSGIYDSDVTPDSIFFGDRDVKEAYDKQVRLAIKRLRKVLTK